MGEQGERTEAGVKNHHPPRVPAELRVYSPPPKLGVNYVVQDMDLAVALVLEVPHAEVHEAAVPEEVPAVVLVVEVLQASQGGCPRRGPCRSSCAQHAACKRRKAIVPGEVLAMVLML